MNFYLVSYMAVTKKNNVRRSRCEFPATGAEIARLAVENLLSRDFTLHSFKILNVELV